MVCLDKMVIRWRFLLLFREMPAREEQGAQPYTPKTENLPMDEKSPLALHQQAMYTILLEFDRVCSQLNIPYVLFAGTMLGAVRHRGFIPWDDDLDVAMLREDYERLLADADRVLDTQRFTLQKEFSDSWPMFFTKLRLNGTTCLEKYHPKNPSHHQGVYIDIFPCDNAYDNALGRKLQYYASRVVIAKSLYARGYDTNSRAKKLFMSLCTVLPGGVFRRISRGPRKATGRVHCFLGGGSHYKNSVFDRSMLTQRVKLPFEDGLFPVSLEHDRLLTILYGDYVTLPSLENRALKSHAILVDLEHSYEMYECYRDDMQFNVCTRSIR